MSTSFRDQGGDDRGAAERSMLWQNNRPAMPKSANANSAASPAKNKDHQILELLTQIRAHLTQIDKEKDDLWEAIQDHTKTLTSIEDLSTSTEKTFISLENRLSRAELKEAPMIERLDSIERTFREGHQQADQDLRKDLFERLDESDMQTNRLIERIDEAMAMQSRMTRRLDKVIQDKQTLSRKIERLEENMNATRDALAAKALVLLTDQSMLRPHANANLPVFTKDHDESGDDSMFAASGDDRPSPTFEERMAPLMSARQKTTFSHSAVLQTLAVLGFILLAAGAGWLLSERIAASGAAVPPPLETAQATPQPAKITDLTARPVSERYEDSIEVASPSYLDRYDQDEMMQRMDEDPEAVAAMLNEIEPTDLDTEAPANNTAPQPPATEAPAAPEEKMTAAEPPPEAPVSGASAKSAYNIDKDPSLPAPIRKIETEAFAGNAEAQHDLAAIYTAGHAGVAQNYERAAFWFKEAADQGIANARYNLGVLYHQGLGVQKDLPAALEWYKKAAQIGHPEAQYNLGIAHIEGIGVNYDPKQAAEYFEAAAASGIPEAGYNLGLIYENGLLGTAQPDEALLWYKTAADAGNKEARTAMEQLAKNLNISPAEIDKLVDNIRTPNQSAAPVQTTQKTASVAAPAAGKTSMVSQIQEQLMSFGLFPGPADGSVSPVTEDAIRTYQSAHNLPVDGQPTEDLLVHMLAKSLKQNSVLPELGSRED